MNRRDYHFAAAQEASVIEYWEFISAVSAPTVYLQAGLHADEISGMLVLHKMIGLLADMESKGELAFNVIVVPQCNPLGIKQLHHGRLSGRFSDVNARNFNRAFDKALAAGTDLFTAWQKALLTLARDADIVIDLHTDDEALPYLYVLPEFKGLGQLLGKHLGVSQVVVWERDLAGCFEEAIADLFDQNPCRDQIFFTTTVELRGQSDVSALQAEKDAKAMIGFFLEIYSERACPRTEQIPLLPIQHIELLTAPVSGVLYFDCELGQRVAEGEVIARILPRPGDATSEICLVAPQAGMVFTRFRDRFIGEGSVVAKLAGYKPSKNWSLSPLDP